MNAMLLAAIALGDKVERFGAYFGYAAVIGLGVLSLLYFAQAREVKRLREWAGRAPERGAEAGPVVAQRRVVAQPVPRATIPGQPPLPQTPAAQQADAARKAAAAAVLEKFQPPAAGQPAPAVGPPGSLARPTGLGQQAGSVPGVLPAGAPGAAGASTPAAGSVPGVPGQAPGSVPGFPGVPGQAPGSVPGFPGVSGQAPGSVPGFPGAPGQAPGSVPQAPGSVPGQAPGSVPGFPGVPGQAPGSVPQAPGSVPGAGVRPAAPGTVVPSAPGPGPGPGVAPSAATAGAVAAARQAAIAGRSPAATNGAGGHDPLPPLPTLPPEPARRPREVSATPPGSSGSRTGLYIGAVFTGLVVIVAVTLLLTSGGGDSGKQANKVTATPPPAAAAKPASAASKVDRKATQIAVLNGTTQNGLAASVGATIEQKGFTILSKKTNADQTIATTSVSYASGQLAAAKLVAQIVNVPAASITPIDANMAAAVPADADVVVLIGHDIATTG